MQRAGFTLIELLIVIALIELMVVTSLVLYASVPSRAALQTTQHDMIQQLRLAQQRARSGDDGGSIGVYVQPTQITVYVGASYSTRTASQDQVIRLVDGVVFLSTQDIQFEPWTGQSTFTGSLMLQSQRNQSTAPIVITSLGLIQ